MLLNVVFGGNKRLVIVNNIVQIFVNNSVDIFLATWSKGSIHKLRNKASVYVTIPTLNFQSPNWPIKI
jgi:hypothetical protein